MNTARKLHDAILTNSLDLVKLYLDAGADPNTSPEIALFDDEKGVKYVDKTYRLLRASPSSLIHPIHVAIVNCYFNSKSLSQHEEHALAILQHLLDAGADVNLKLSAMYLCNIQGNNCRVTAMDSFDLVTFLKQHLWSAYEHETQSMLNKVTKFIIDSSAKTQTLSKIPTTTVPKSVKTTFKKLLLSEKYSDVRFVCPDGTELCAHRNILAAASPYFDAAFQGSWSENNPEGKWPTANSAKVMRAVLRFIYVGGMDNDLLENDTVNLLSVATEYQLDSLIELCETKCIQKLSTSNVKTMLELAHLHSTTRLKQACFQFVKKNATTVMFDPQVMSLASQNKRLWSELEQAVSGSDSSTRTSNKRQKVKP